MWSACFEHLKYVKPPDNYQLIPGLSDYDWCSLIFKFEHWAHSIMWNMWLKPCGIFNWPDWIRETTNTALMRREGISEYLCESFVPLKMKGTLKLRWQYYHIFWLNNFWHSTFINFPYFIRINIILFCLYMRMRERDTGMRKDQDILQYQPKFNPSIKFRS